MDKEQDPRTPGVPRTSRVILEAVIAPTWDVTLHQVGNGDAIFLTISHPRHGDISSLLDAQDAENLSNALRAAVRTRSNIIRPPGGLQA